MNNMSLYQGVCCLKNKENQTLKDYDLLTLMGLILVTLLSYGSYSRHIFSSEKISSNQVKAEILAYQAAQIFLLKNVEKDSLKGSRSIASENNSMEGVIGEDSSGKPYRFHVIQEGKDSYRVVLTSDSDLNAKDTKDKKRFELNIKTSER